MKKVGVIGLGQMGRVIAWAMQNLGHSLVLVDCYKKSRSLCKDLLDEYNPGNGHVFADDKEALLGCSLVISALPYHQNLRVAILCIDNGIKYCDLGGKVDVSQEINEYAAQGSVPVMTDLGLAPGWANIVAEHVYHKKSGELDGKAPERIDMMVGGLPVNANNFLKYGCTWSYDGLINEYKDDCEILSGKAKKIMPGMEGLKHLTTKIGTLEAFYTSGGMSHTMGVMERRGVKNCTYRTLRYVGHRDIVRFLIRDCDLDHKTLVNIFKTTCPPLDDLVILRVEADDLVHERVIWHSKLFSAMQKCTAFPIAAVADLILQDAFSYSSTINGNVLKYMHVPYGPFNKRLQRLFTEATGGSEESTSRSS
jgi:saccharopine dehydrogenase-like NADP-dependent oxidoreductase